MKNIILIISDTYRYDNLGRRARCPINTPSLDAFGAERAMEVSHLIAGSFPTIPQRTDLTTGRVGWPWHGWQPLNLSSKNHWPQMLRKQGYQTQLICDCPHLFNAGFQGGFNAALQNRGQEGDCPLLHLNDPIQTVMPPEKTRTHGPGHTLADWHRWTNRYFQREDSMFCSKTSATAVKWLEENYRSENPFFLWVDFFDPHEPWDPPEYMVKRYDPDYEGIPMIHPNYGRSTAYTPEELQNLWAHYAAEAELVDRAIGRVLQKIDDLQLWDDSVVVMTSDHGFSIGEHGSTGKSNINKDDERTWPLFPEINRVPFLVAAAGVAAGSVCDMIAQPADILPTISEMAGVKVDMPEPVHGRSFKAALEGKTKSHREFAVTASHADWSADDFPAKACSPFVTTKKWGYAPVGQQREELLFDLEADPWTERNIIDKHPQQAAKMREMMLEHLAELGEETPALDFWRRRFGKTA